ncbi:hypothetical protein Trydic_g9745 [Trypoxylus dichotomus]
MLTEDRVIVRISKGNRRKNASEIAAERLRKCDIAVLPADPGILSDCNEGNDNGDTGEDKVNDFTGILERHLQEPKGRFPAHYSKMKKQNDDIDKIYKNEGNDINRIVLVCRKCKIEVNSPIQNFIMSPVTFFIAQKRPGNNY